MLRMRVALGCALAAAVVFSARAQVATAVKASQAVKKPRVEVCFVLDTTGSMGALIEGAKAKIWSIANQMISAKPTPEIRLALIGYRDRGDAYVTQVFDLDSDIDAVYLHLREFQAGGGGDSPESVNQALAEAVNKISWSSDTSVLKIIFLVGDCPPHMDYQDDVKYPDTCRAAVRKDLIINTIQCGSNATTAPIWREIAKLSEGRYVSIGQTGDVQIIATPVDEKLARLNVEIGETLVPYGGTAIRAGVVAKQAASEAAPATVAADRLLYSARAGKAMSGGGDLVDAIDEGRVKLKDMKPEDLPVVMQKMSAEQQRVYVVHQAEKRGRLQEEIAKLLKQRQAYIDSERRKLSEAGRRDAFDEKVSAIIREQGRRKGINYAEPPKADESKSGDEKP